MPLLLQQFENKSDVFIRCYDSLCQQCAYVPTNIFRSTCQHTHVHMYIHLNASQRDFVKQRVHLKITSNNNHHIYHILPCTTIYYQKYKRKRSCVASNIFYTLFTLFIHHTVTQRFRQLLIFSAILVLPFNSAKAIFCDCAHTYINTYIHMNSVANSVLQGVKQEVWRKN